VKSDAACRLSRLCCARAALRLRQERRTNSGASVRGHMVRRRRYEMRVAIEDARCLLPTSSVLRL